MTVSPRAGRGVTPWEQPLFHSPTLGSDVLSSSGKNGRGEVFASVLWIRKISHSPAFLKLRLHYQSSSLSHLFPHEIHLSLEADCPQGHSRSSRSPPVSLDEPKTSQALAYFSPEGAPIGPLPVSTGASTVDICQENLRESALEL